MTQPAVTLTPGRVAALLGGAVLFLVGLIVTLGFAVGGALGIVAASYIQRARKGSLTHATRWIGAAVGAAVAFLLVVAVALLRAPNGTWHHVQHGMARSQEQPVKIPEWERRYIPGAQENAVAVQGVVKPLYESSAFDAWIMIMVAVFFSSFVGVYAGSVAWGTITLIMFGITGQWRGPTVGP